MISISSLNATGRIEIMPVMTSIMHISSYSRLILDKNPSAQAFELLGDAMMSIQEVYA